MYIFESQLQPSTDFRTLTSLSDRNELFIKLKLALAEQGFTARNCRELLRGYKIIVSAMSRGPVLAGMASS